MKFTRPILPRYWNSLLEYFLDFPIGCFNLTTCVWMVRHFYSVLDSILKKKNSKIFEMKWDPLSLITSLCIPNLRKMMFLKSLITTRASFVGEAPASNHFDTLSTVTSINLFPGEDGKWTIRSIPHTSKISTSKMFFNGISPRLEMFPVHWHQSHLITAVWTSFHRLVQ